MKTSGRVLAAAGVAFFLRVTTTAQTEYKYDDGVGAQVLTLSANDTIAVYFDAVPGHIIDSIRVAFNKVGSMNFGLWRYTGFLASPLGTVLAAPSAITVSSGSDNATLPTSAGTTKWVKKDLTSLNISANPGFVVAGIVGADPAVPGVLVSQVPVTGNEHSLTYTTGQWRILTAGSNVYRYLIRVYAHLTTGVDVVELVPTFFVLSQNYPNPFNSQTRIEYEIPANTGKSSLFVDLSMYNVLGEKIKTLVQGYQSNGRHVELWDGTDDRGVRAVSGVYFYRLTAEGQMSSKKLLLVK